MQIVQTTRDRANQAAAIGAETLKKENKMNYEDAIEAYPMLINTVYGTVEIKFIPGGPAFMAHEIKIESTYLATVVNGPYKGRQSDHYILDRCLGNLLANISYHSASRILDEELCKRGLAG